MLSRIGLGKKMIKWAEVPYIAGAEQVIELPRMVNIESIQLTTPGTPAATGGTYVANKLIKRVKLEFKAQEFYNRISDMLREIMENNDKFPPQAEFWKLEPGSLKGSESNILKILFSTLAELSPTGTPTAVTNGTITVHYKPASILTRRILDYNFFKNYVATTGKLQYTIPSRRQTIKWLLLQMYDGTTLTNLDIRVKLVNALTNEIKIDQTLRELQAKAQSENKYETNTGYLLLGLNIPQTLDESYFLEFDLITAGTAVTLNGLVITEHIPRIKRR